MTPLETLELSKPKTRAQIRAIKARNYKKKTTSVSMVAGLPDPIERVAKALQRKNGWNVSRSIASAVAQLRKRAAEGDRIAQKAIEKWDKMRKENRGPTGRHARSS